VEVRISVVIITYNEAKNIGKCLDSVISIADEIVVVDSFSTDATESICNRYKAKFVQHKFEGHIQQKNYAISQASFPYVLSLDADEMLSKNAISDIKYIKNNWTHDGYSFNRLNNYCGQWIKHGGWYPDRKLRLWDTTLGKWEGENPHDEFKMTESSRVKTLKSDILHYTLSTREEHKKQIEYFTTIAAQAAFEKGKKSSYFKMLASSLLKFIKDYIFKLGFLDGKNGFIIASLSAGATYTKYRKLKDLNCA